jgi:GrpB-like predicted nucleotidyltransferase (UPF0157 family)
MLGLKKGEVRLSAHSDNWKNLFDEEKILLQSIIGNYTKDIQHFGSTAIEGIEAKPLIDILVGVTSMKDIEKFDTNELMENGYHHLSRVQIEGKVVFAKFSDLKNLIKTHVLHVVEYNGRWWKEHIFFRNYLNDNPETAIEYEQLKRSLASKYPEDESSYTDEKKKFVDKILSQL